MESCMRFHCRGSGIRLGSHWAAGTNENKGEGFAEGEEGEDKELRLLDVETDKGDIPIQKEYFQLWYMQGTPYALYDNYAYVTL